MTTKLKIKNMVCRHCIEAVLALFKGLDIEINAIRLGEIELMSPLEKIDLPKLKLLLKQNGFELLEDKESQLVEAIKTTIIKMIYHETPLPNVKNSVYLSEKLQQPYVYLSRIFSKSEHLTIEKYIILQKIERVKELLSYEESTLSEIAFSLGYKSVQHLSNQFKSITGMSVRIFKAMEQKERWPINELPH